MEDYETNLIESYGKPSAEYLQDLRKRFLLLIQGLSKTDEAHLVYNARTLQQIMAHLAKSLDIEYKDVIKYCLNLKNRVVVEDLRKGLVRGL